MDEQCIADIAACIVGGQLIERSKDALDEIYTLGSAESDRMLSACEAYGIETFSEELKFCIDQILMVCASGKREKLRDVIFKKRTTNPFPSVFAVIAIAFHELIVKEGKKIIDFEGVRKVITNLSERIETGRKAVSAEERRKNIDTTKGLINDYFAAGNIRAEIHKNPATTKCLTRKDAHGFRPLRGVWRACGYG